MEAKKPLVLAGHWNLAYCNKGELAKAVADCTEAIKLAPKVALAYKSPGGSPAAKRANLRRPKPTSRKPRNSGTSQNDSLTNSSR